MYGLLNALQDPPNDGKCSNPPCLIHPDRPSRTLSSGTASIASMTRLLLLSSATFLGILGLTGTFAPAETLVLLGVDPLPAVVVLFQMGGGLYLGFALLNWMSRNAPMGGIYGKPVATANLIHFLVVALMLIKEVLNGDLGNGFLILCVLYTLFAAGFASTLFRDPLSGRTPHKPA